MTPFITARMSCRRLPPPGFAGGMNVTGISAPPRARPEFPRYWRSFADLGEAA